MDQNYKYYFIPHLFSCVILEMKAMWHLQHPFITAASQLIEDKASAYPRLHKKLPTNTAHWYLSEGNVTTKKLVKHKHIGLFLAFQTNTAFFSSTISKGMAWPKALWKGWKESHWFPMGCGMVCKQVSWKTHSSHHSTAPLGIIRCKAEF